MGSPQKLIQKIKLPCMCSHTIRRRKVNNEQRHEEMMEVLNKISTRLGWIRSFVIGLWIIGIAFMTFRWG
jgi:hypothetical protein